MSKVKIKESVTVKKPVVMKEAPKTIMECGKDVNFVIDIRPRGVIIAYPDSYVTKEQAVICFEEILKFLKNSDRKTVSLMSQDYYDSGDAENEFWG